MQRAKPLSTKTKLDLNDTSDLPKVLYDSTQSQPEYQAPFTIDVLFRILKVTLFHWSFGLILLPCIKTLFDVSIGWDSIWVRLCIYQVVLSGLASLFGLVVEEKGLSVVDRKGWNDHVIVITGGSNGLGLLLAQTFAMRRAYVAILDVVEPNVKDGGISFFPCDVSDYKQVEQALKEIKEELGTPTVLINNAGIIRPKPIMDSTTKDIERTINVNLTSNFWTTKVVLPWMIEEKTGFIITISSILGLTSPALATAYCASKAGQIAFHDSLNQELSTHNPEANIKTLLVVPGQMDTGMFNGVPSPAFPFLFPPAEPLEIANLVLDHVHTHKSGEISLPLFTYLGPLAKLTPLRLRRWVYNLTGANMALLGWVGHRRDRDDKEESNSPLTAKVVVPTME